MAGMKTMAGKTRREKMENRQKDLKKGSGSYDYFIFKEGTQRMRVVPVVEEEEIGAEVLTFFFGKEIGGFISAASFGESCPAYDQYMKLSKSKDDDDKALAAQFKPRKKYMVPHIKYKDEKGQEVDEEAGVKLAQLTKGQYDTIIGLFLDDEQGDFTDPLKGYDLKYKRTGTSLTDTEYTVTPCKPSKLPQKFRKPVSPEEMVKEIIPSYEEAKFKLDQFLGNKSDDANDEDLPFEKKKKKSTKPAPVIEVKKKKKLRGDI